MASSGSQSPPPPPSADDDDGGGPSGSSSRKRSLPSSSESSSQESALQDSAQGYEAGLESYVPPALEWWPVMPAASPNVAEAAEQPELEPEISPMAPRILFPEASSASVQAASAGPSELVRESDREYKDRMKALAAEQKRAKEAKEAEMPTGTVVLGEALRQHVEANAEAEEVALVVSALVAELMQMLVWEEEDAEMEAMEAAEKAEEAEEAAWAAAEAEAAEEVSAVVARLIENLVAEAAWAEIASW